jgi:hypothetical protein
VIKILSDFNARQPHSEGFNLVSIFPDNNPTLDLREIKPGTDVLGYDFDGTELIGTFYIGGAYGYGVLYTNDWKKLAAPFLEN